MFPGEFKILYMANMKNIKTSISKHNFFSVFPMFTGVMRDFGDLRIKQPRVGV